MHRFCVELFIIKTRFSYVSITPKNVKRRVKSPSRTGNGCVTMTPEESIKFILGVETKDWKIERIEGGIEDECKVTHIYMKFIGTPDLCPSCSFKRENYDSRTRVWRHANLDDTICYIHADIPRMRCPTCGKIEQVNIPWADPNVSYTKRFMEVAIEHMSQMSLRATSRMLNVSWKVLDDIVGRVVNDYLDNMDLSNVRRIRMDETSGKKHHKYLSIVTDVDTGNIIFITSGKKYSVVEEFVLWLKSHNGNPDNIDLVSVDFGDAFAKGSALYLPSAEIVRDPFHLVQIANRHLDHDRASSQINGERIKRIRYALLKNPDNLNDEEKIAVLDITKDNNKVSLSYQMKENLRQIFSYPKEMIELIRYHLKAWVDWASEMGSNGFKALAKTVKGNYDGIVRAIETGINNAFQESLNGRVQLSKALGRGYGKLMRLGRIVYFRDLYKTY